MASFVLKEGAWVLVGDGRKALILINAGNAKFPNLRRLAVEWHDNPPTRDQGADAPGRAFASIGHRRSAVETTDWHNIEESRFAAAIAEKINNSARQGEFKQLVIVAPPKTLAELRRRLSMATRNRLAGEVDKDLTKHSIEEIERLLTAHQSRH